MTNGLAPREASRPHSNSEQLTDPGLQPATKIAVLALVPPDNWRGWFRRGWIPGLCLGRRWYARPADV